MQFEMRHKFLAEREPETFSESDPPAWLTGKGTAVGSTMDCRWFWRDHVLTLEVGASIETDFRAITRTA